MNILEDFRLEQKVALMTGVGRGLGQAMAVALAEAGADIAGLYHTRYQETQRRVEAAGRRFLPIQLDLGAATVDDLNQAVAQVKSGLGRLDILVNNAGIVRRAPAIDYDEADWDDVLKINLKSLFFLSQAAARVMVDAGRGKIINIASVLSYQGGVTVPAYAATKHGISGITQALSNEWAAQGINVNAIAPGYMETDITTALRADPARNRAILERIPAGRWGKSDDLKGVVVFLASAASDYMHGTTIPVDGGWLGR